MTQPVLTSEVDHIGLTVSDLAATRTLFTDCLGWTLLWEIPAYPDAFVTDGTTRVTLWEIRRGKPRPFRQTPETSPPPSRPPSVGPAHAQSHSWARFRGNVQYISAGNIAADGRVALILMDYPNRRRLKLWARAYTRTRIPPCWRVSRSRPTAPGSSGPSS
ncbi:VOC family protein [Pseudaminobacter soli (ex Zhang et al. 2022)]|uniref:VOC family protein n=1 Tax=Pseudaminobacter soli (ex Zhang et al. 2022) TaxID=2831468 RepID=UPI003CC80BF1